MKNVRIITAIIVSGFFMASCSEQDTFENYLEPTTEVQNVNGTYNHPERMLEPFESITDDAEENGSNQSTQNNSATSNNETILEEIKPAEGKPALKHTTAMDREAPTREREPISKDGILELEPSNPDYGADQKVGTTTSDSDVIKPIERTEFLEANETQK